MTHFFGFLAAVPSVFALSACEPFSYVTDPSGPDALNIGTKSQSQSASGFPFAGPENLGSLEGRYEVVGRLVRFVADYDTGERSIVVTDEQLVLNFVDDPEAAFVESITFNGETYTFGVAGEADLPNGQILNMQAVEGASNVGVLNVFSYTLGDGFDTDGFIVLGLQTNPTNLPISGSATFDGGILGYGNLFDGNGFYLEDRVFFDGTATIEIDFDDMAVTETAVFLQIEDPALYQSLNFSGDGADFVGNGFADSLGFSSCPDLAQCSGGVLIGGAFFGEVGDQLAGNVAVDYTISVANPDDSDRFIGSGYFIASEDP